MKKITLLLSVLLVSIGYSQTDLETFEGAAPTIGIANATAGTAANIVANPSVDANNGSATVLQFITGDAGDPWQQAELTLQGDFLDLSATGASFSMDVYSMEAFDVLVRVTDGVASNGSTAADSAADAIHGGTGWETLTFDFSAGETQDGLGVPTGVYGKNIYSIFGMQMMQVRVLADGLVIHLVHRKKHVLQQQGIMIILMV